MSLKLNYLDGVTRQSTANLVLFCNEKLSISSLKKYISENEHSYISDLVKTSDIKKNLFVFKVHSKKTIFLISIKKDLKTFEIENLGAELFSQIKNEKKMIIV